MKLIFKVALPVILISFLFNSCKKYEEGPAFSLRTKKARLTGDWTVNKILVNDVDQTAAFLIFIGANYGWDIEKDGTYKMTGTVTDAGTWKLGEDKDDLYLTSSTPGTKEESYRIVLLKNKELGLKQTQPNGDVIKFYFKQ